MNSNLSEKREDTNSQISVRANTTKRVSVKHDNGSSTSFAVAIPPSDGKSVIKYSSLQWLGLPSVLTDMLHVRQRLRSPAPAPAAGRPCSAAPGENEVNHDLRSQREQSNIALPFRQTKKAVLINKRIN